MKINKSLIIAIFCLLSFCIMAVIFKVFSITALPVSFVGAAMGAVITGVVTVVLLDGQSKAEEIKERNVKVFEKKSTIFSEYIDIIWKTWEDRKVSDTEFKDLVSGYYKKLMLYMSASSADTIGKQLKIIGTFAGNDEPSKDAQDKLQIALIEIINTLSDEISLGGHIKKELFEDLEKKAEEAKDRSRSQRTTFAMVGIKKGVKLVWKNDPSVTCIVEDDINNVKYGDKVRSISNVAMELNNGKSANGFDWFTFNGKTLGEIRKDLEKNL